MNLSKPCRILFFIADCMPTVEDYIEAAKLNGDVVFRNASAVPEAGNLEQCDGVAGDVPTNYAEAYPTAEDAIAARNEALQAISEQVGDSPAPRSKKAPTKAQQAAVAAATKPAWGDQNP